MADHTSVGDLSRGQLLQMAQELTKLAMEAKDAETTAGKPRHYGSPKDPAVRRLAAFAMYDLKDREGASFEDIGNLLGISRERAYQLYHDLVDKHDPEEKLQELEANN